MRAGRLLTPLAAKEVRALLPAWLVSIAASSWSSAYIGVAAAASDDRAFHALGLVAFGAGSIALGAISLGHEYSHGTLPLLLAQPIHRARLVGVKLLVLAVMLLSLAAAASGLLYWPVGTMAVIPMVVLSALFVVPLLTMVARNPLAGAVFSIAVPGVVWGAIDMLVASPFKWVFFWRVMLGVSAAAAVLLWRTFMRLEGIDARGPQVHLPFAAAGGVALARRRHPIWLLVKKELALQHLTYVIAAIYLLLWLRLGPHPGPESEDALMAATVLYSGLLAVLIGSMASAEERQFGTIEWQMLLPMAAWKQWSVKAGTALLLSLLLTFALPALLLAEPIRGARNEWYACAILLLTAGSLYVSSLSSSGLRAFVVSFWVPLVMFTVLRLFGGFIDTRLALAPIAGLLALLLWFGMLNHRSAERGAWRVSVQVFCIAGCLAFGAALLAVL